MVCSDLKNPQDAENHRLKRLNDIGHWRNAVSNVLFRERELTEFCGKLGEFCKKLGEFALAHK